MVRRIIILSNVEPDKNVFWFKDGKILYYEAGQWMPIKAGSGFEDNIELEERLNNIEKRLTELQDYIKGDSPIYITDTQLTDILSNYVKKEDITGGIYTPTISESIAVTADIGNIKAGTTLSQLKGKSISSIIDLMLVSEIWNDPQYKHIISASTIPNIVKVGTSVQNPLYVGIWNTRIIPNEGVKSVINKTSTVSIPGHDSDSEVSKYDVSGKAIFTYSYNYGEGTYIINSNLGNQKTVVVPAKTDSLVQEVDVTYPWFINTVEQTLVPIGTEFTQTVMLDGTPSIKVPFTNSEIKVQADLGFGYMDVEWEESVDNSNLGEAISETVPYKVLTKPDSYNTPVAHKITIKINK